MREYPKDRFVPHTYKRECDRCGWDYLRTELMNEERTGLIVCASCYDPVHPRDSVGVGGVTMDIREQPLIKD